jgi:hypothetical protein
MFAATSMLAMADLSQYVKNASDYKVFLAPNTSDAEIISRARKRLSESGIDERRLQVNYDIQLLETGDLYASYEPPDLVVRHVYDKKASGVVKMKSVAVIRL